MSPLTYSSFALLNIFKRKMLHISKFMLYDLNWGHLSCSSMTLSGRNFWIWEFFLWQKQMLYVATMRIHDYSLSVGNFTLFLSVGNFEFNASAKILLGRISTSHLKHTVLNLKTFCTKLSQLCLGSWNKQYPTVFCHLSHILVTKVILKE